MRGAYILVLATLSSGAFAETITFSSGLSATLPPHAKALPQRPLAPNLQSVRAYELGVGTLVVTEAKLGPGQPCEGALTSAWTQMQGQKESSDPDIAKQVLLAKLERRTVAGVSAIYSEAGTRNAEQAKANGPYHSAAAYLLCKKNTFLNFVMTGGTTNPIAGALLETVVKSLR